MLLACIASLTLFAAQRAQPAAPQTPLRLGMCTALSGPSAELGREMLLGVRAAIDEDNRTRGASRRPYELVALDDGYEPSRTTPHMLRLARDPEVIAVVGNVGTPTAIAALPIVEANGLPFVAPFTGAGVLRKTPPDAHVFNFRASYAEETAAMVDALVDHGGVKCDEIALFTQRDAFGDAGYAGAIAAMQAHGLTDERTIAHLRYERNTVAVEEAVASLLLLERTPRAVILVGTYAPCASFIRQCRELGVDARFLCISFVGARALAEALGPDSADVLVTQVVPHVDADLPGVRRYRAALAAHDPDARPSGGSLEGYLGARMLLLAAERCDPYPTRASLTTQLARLGDFDLGIGAPLHLSSDDHQASHRVWFTVVRRGQVLPCEPSEITR